MLIQQLGGFHHWVIETKDNLDPLQWLVDAQSLKFALKIIETVELWFISDCNNLT